jgi:gluconolactonase
VPEGYLQNGIWMLKDGKLSLALSADDLGAAPNGITVSPDEKYMYLSAMFKLVRYDIQADGTLSNRKVLGEGEGIIDGMKVDTRGNIYSTSGAGPGVVRISAPDGKVLGLLRLPINSSEPKQQICATNVAFGGADNRTLFIAGCDSLYSVRMKVPGVAEGPRG